MEKINLSDYPPQLETQCKKFQEIQKKFSKVLDDFQALENYYNTLAKDARITEEQQEKIHIILVNCLHINVQKLENLL